VLNIGNNTGYDRRIISSTTRPIVNSKNNKQCHSPVSNIYVAVNTRVGTLIVTTTSIYLRTTDTK